MKKSKRLISLLLSILMVTSAFSGISFNAFAAPAQQKKLVEVVPTLSGPIEVIEKTNGSYNTNETLGGTDLFIYDVLAINSKYVEGISLKYDDGSTVYYANINNNGHYENNLGESLDYSVRDYQYTNQFKLGSDNHYQIVVNEITADVSVTIIENPVLSMEFTVANPKVFVEYMDGFYQQDGEYYYDIYGYIDSEGNCLTVNYRDGRTVKYIYNNENSAFLDDNGNEIRLQPNYQANELKVGVNKIGIFSNELPGVSCTLDFEIVESPVDHIEYKMVDPLVIKGNIDGNTLFNSFDYDLATLYNNTLNVYYKDGTTDVFIPTNNYYKNYVNEEGKEITVYIPYECQNAVYGQNEIVIKAFGKSATVPFTLESIYEKGKEPVSLTVDSGNVIVYDGFSQATYWGVKPIMDTSSVVFNLELADGTVLKLKDNDKYCNKELFISAEDSESWTPNGTYYAYSFYNDLHTNVPVKYVQTTVASVEVLTPPTRTQYATKEHIDIEGMQVKVNYTDSTSKVVTLSRNDIISENFDDTDDGEYSVGFNYSASLKVDGHSCLIKTEKDENSNLVNCINIEGKTCSIDGIKFDANLDVKSIEILSYTEDCENISAKVTLNNGEVINYVKNPETGESLDGKTFNVYAGVQRPHNIEQLYVTVGGVSEYVKISHNYKVHKLEGQELTAGYYIVECTNCDMRYLTKTPPAVEQEDGWAQEGDNWCYYENGVKVTNRWIADSQGWCYLDSNGYMATDTWAMDSQGWCYLDNTGHCVTNTWKADSHGWCYLDGDGRMVKNRWVADSQGWCYLDGNGYMATNTWAMDSQGWCYLDNTGHCATNTWKADSHGWVYLDNNGRMVTWSWVIDSTDWCYVGGDGYMVTNTWIADSQGWCYLDSNGHILRNGYAWDSMGQHYLDASGHMVW